MGAHCYYFDTVCLSLSPVAPSKSVISAEENNGPVSAQMQCTRSSWMISVIVEIKVEMSHNAFSSFDRKI